MPLHRPSICQLARTASVLVFVATSGCASLNLRTRGGGPVVQEMAPAFRLRAMTGNDISLTDVLAQGPVVLVFYESSKSSHCRKQLDEFNRNLGEFRRRGAILLAVSADSPETSAQLAKDLHLAFPLLSDPSLETIQAYGMARMEKDAAVPGIFIIPQSGRIYWKYVSEAMGDRPSLRWVLYILDDALGQTSESLKPGAVFPHQQKF
ncbi:MAG: redoxin domain-containing protein [Nitrospirae bacterium]|nr:redoxin domain-containing protein [Nitrospirota bacterium]